MSNPADGYATPAEIQDRLAQRFSYEEIKLKPGVVAKDGKSAMAMAHVDARAVAQRLDDVLGIGNWQDDYTLLPNGMVECRIQIRIGGDWIQKTDVGSPSKQPGHDATKAAYSDAFKRACYKLGIGRYLYSIKNEWIAYDGQYKRFDKAAAESLRKRISKPSAAQPAKPQPARPPATRPAPAVESAAIVNRIMGEQPPTDQGDAYEGPPAAAPAAASAEKPKPAAKPRPANGRELEHQLFGLDRKLHAEGRCRSDELMTAVLLHIRRLFPSTVEGEPPAHIYQWTPEQIEAACNKANDFVSKLPKKEDVRREQ